MAGNLVNNAPGQANNQQPGGLGGGAAGAIGVQWLKPTALQRGTAFAGFLCEDPKKLKAQCDLARIPTDRWRGKANRYTCPLVGLKPGVAHVLLLDAALRQIDNAAYHPLSFQDDVVGRGPALVVAPSLRVVGVPVGVTIGVPGTGTYLVELADRRIDCEGISSRRYNWRTFPDSDYESGSKNPDTSAAWTWAELFEDLWDAVGNLGPFPGLPRAVPGTPQQIDAHGVRAADALEDLLALHFMGVVYHPLRDAFDLCYFGSADGDAALTAAGLATRRWLIADQSPIVGKDPPIPEYVRVLFPVWRPAATDTAPDAAFAVDVVGGATLDRARVVANSISILHDISPARVNSAGSVLNAADLVTRAQALAADFFVRCQFSVTNFGPFHQTYSGVWAPDGFMAGLKTDLVVWEVADDGYKTHFARAGLAGFPPLFDRTGAALYPSGSLVSTAGSYANMLTYPGGSSLTNPTLAPRRAGNVPPAPSRTAQAERLGIAGIGPGTITDWADGRGMGPLLRRGGPLRQWDSQIVGRGARDGGIGRPWRQLPPAQRVRFVRVTDTTPDDDRYPAKEQLYDPAAKTWSDGPDCWYVDANGDSVAEGRKLAKLEGYANGRRVWAAVEGGGSDCEAVRACVDDYPDDGDTLTIEAGPVCLTTKTLTVVDGVLYLDDVAMPDGVQVVVSGTQQITRTKVPASWVQSSICRDAAACTPCEPTETVEIECCEGYTAPATLYLTMTATATPGATTSWGCVPTTTVLTWNPSTGYWEGVSEICVAGCFDDASAEWLPVGDEACGDAEPCRMQITWRLRCSGDCPNDPGTNGKFWSLRWDKVMVGEGCYVDGIGGITEIDNGTAWCDIDICLPPPIYLTGGEYQIGASSCGTCYVGITITE